METVKKVEKVGKSHVRLHLRRSRETRVLLWVVVPWAPPWGIPLLRRRRRGGGGGDIGGGGGDGSGGDGEAG